MKFTALAFLLICEKLYGHVDWSSFECIEVVDGGDSLSLIKSLPMHQYWDVQKGSFRTGIIGEQLNKTLPHYVSSLSTKVGKGGTSSNMESLVVDQAALYMHGISALRSLGNISKAIQDAVNIDGIVPTADLTTDLRVNTSCEPSIDDVKALQNSALVQLTAISTIAAEVEDNFQLTMRLLSEKNSVAVSDQLLVHNSQIEILNGYYGKVFRTFVDKYDRIGRDHSVSEVRLRSLRMQITNDEYSSANTASLRQVERTMETLRFRAAEELKMVKQQQEFEDTQLSSTRSEMLQAEVEQVIGAFFAEMVSCAQQVVANPRATLSAVMYGLLVAAIMLTILELSRIVSEVARRLAGASHLPQVRPLASRPSIGSMVRRQLFWSTAVAEGLGRICLTVRTAVGNSLPLPCVLVSGPTGSGKSAALQSILEDLSLGSRSEPGPIFIMEVCGADLRALGDGEATRFLNDLVHGNRAGPLLLVVDDADCIIQRRTSSTEACGRGDRRSSRCLFALLAGLRENSAKVGLLLTTRLNVGGVDEAILDRLDSTLFLPLPDQAQRLRRSLDALRCLELKLTASGAALSGAEWEVVGRLANECPSVALSQVMEAAMPPGLPVSVASFLGTDLPATTGPPVGSAVAAAQASSDPETDTPRSLLRTGNCEEADAASLLQLLRSTLPSLSDDGLHSTFCLRATLALSGGWSNRELNQLFSALDYVVMCNEGCRLTTRMWIQELVYAADKRETPI